MDCNCSSCVRLGLAEPRHIGDCDRCNADGDTVLVPDRVSETMDRPYFNYALCADCAKDPVEAFNSIAESAASDAYDDDRCWRGHAE